MVDSSGNKLDPLSKWSGVRSLALVYGENMIGRDQF